MTATTIEAAHTRARGCPAADWVISIYCCGCGVLLAVDERPTRLCQQCGEAAAAAGRRMAREFWEETVLPCLEGVADG